jgi:hypothetical protein
MRFLGRVGDWAIRSALVIIPVMLVPFLSGHAFICSASRQSRRPRTPRRVLTTPPNAVSSVTIDISFSQAGTYILTLTRATRLHGQRATTCAWAKLLDFPSRAGCRRRNLLAQLRQREATSFVALGVRSLGSNSRRRYFKVDWTALRRLGLRRGSARLLLDACIFATVHADRKPALGFVMAVYGGFIAIPITTLALAATASFSKAMGRRWAGAAVIAGTSPAIAVAVSAILHGAKYTN